MQIPFAPQHKWNSLEANKFGKTTWRKKNEYSEVTNEAGGSISFRIVGSHGSTTYSALEGWLSTTAMPFPASEPAMPDLDGVAGPVQGRFLVKVVWR